MFVLFLSPPEIPRVICVPTLESSNRDQSRREKRFASQSLIMKLTTSDKVTLASWPCVIIYLTVSHLGKSQLFDEMIHSSLFLALWHRAGQTQSCGKMQILPNSQSAHDHIFLGERQGL